MSSDSLHLRTKITGVCLPAQAFAIAELLHRNPAPVWLVVHEEVKQTDSLGEDISLFHRAAGAKIPLEIQIGRAHV